MPTSTVRSAALTGEKKLTQDSEAATAQDRDYVQAVGRGLEVLRVFGNERRPLSVTEVASLTGITRTAARRFILTLEHMGICPLTVPRAQFVPQCSKSVTPTSSVADCPK